MLYLISEANEPLKYVSSGHLLSRGDFIHPTRNLDTYVFIVVLEGVLHIQQQDRQYNVGPNQFIILYAGMDHCGFMPSKGTLSYHWVHFTMSEHASNYVEAENAAKCRQLWSFDPNHVYLMPEYGSLEISSQVTQQFTQMLHDAKRRGHPCPLLHYALSQMVLQLSYLLLLNPGIDEYPLFVAKAIDWITNNYQLPLTVGGIAAHFHYHPTYLSTGIKRYTGMSMNQYINYVRINVAKSLLTNYDLSVSDIATQCGYRDEKYFMRVFKQILKSTPSEYRSSFARYRQID